MRDIVPRGLEFGYPFHTKQGDIVLAVRDS